MANYNTSQLQSIYNSFYTSFSHKSTPSASEIQKGKALMEEEKKRQEDFLKAVNFLNSKGWGLVLSSYPNSGKHVAGFDTRYRIVSSTRGGYCYVNANDSIRCVGLIGTVGIFADASEFVKMCAKTDAER